MKITLGLFDHMVIQRTAKGTSQQPIQGECAAGLKGSVHVSVVQNRRTAKGFANRKIGTAARGRFSAELTGLPTGGPYELRLTLRDSAGKEAAAITVRDVLVGDVWILAGQSNMQGCGYRTERLKPSPHVRAFYMDDHWGVAQDPLHDLSISIDDFHRGGSIAPHIGTGPGVAFGQALQKATGVPQGLIACAHGGTSMADWSPTRKRLGGASLYGATYRRFVKNGSRVAGIFWYQGCSDTTPETMTVYTRKMQELIRSFRRDFKAPSLPVVVVQIARVCRRDDPHGGWNSVREQQRLLPKTIPHLLVVPGVDLTLDDGIHISGIDAHRIGRRAAGAAAVLKYPKVKAAPPIEFAGTRIERNPLTGATNVLVRFKNVVGSLRATGRPSGFTLAETPDNAVDDPTYDIELLGDTVRLKTAINPMTFQEKYLFYGYGNNPYCNITDTADRSLPCFGPIPVFANHVYAPLIIRLAVSDLLPSAGKLEGLAYPQDQADLGFTVRTFDNNGWGFCNLHAELSAREPEDLLVYFRNRFRCTEPMKVDLLFGYDGPVKVWLDGREIHADPKGINPAVIDKHRVPMALTAGDHELLVALGSNHGKAWGVFLRYKRTDVPLRLLKKGRDAYHRPESLDL